MSRLGVRIPGTVSSILDVSGSLYETRFRYRDNPDASLLDRTLLPPASYRLRSSYEDSFLGRTFSYPDMWSPSADNRWAARYGLSWKPNSTDKRHVQLQKRLGIDQGFSRTFITAHG